MTSDSAPTPSPATVGASRDRLCGLNADSRAALREVEACLKRRSMDHATRFLARAAAMAPEHPEVLRLGGLERILGGDIAAAVPFLERSLVLRPDDAPTLNELASARYSLGDFDAAIELWRRSLEADPAFLPALLNLGRNLKLAGRGEECIEPLRQAVEQAPDHLLAREMYADALIAVGKFDAAAGEFHCILGRKPDSGAAWWGLAKIKTRQLHDAEFDQLQRLLSRPDLAERERMPMSFALGKACEDRAFYPQAIEALHVGNRLARRQRAWNARLFTQRIDSLLQAARNTTEQATTTDLGNEIIFIVSLPRAGSTLTEQVLAAHADVEGAGELSDLASVLDTESRRRGCELPFWMEQASPADWQRLGCDYLERTSRWRERCPRSTDKLPNNWFLVAAIRAMLPGARIVNCRRDPLETCWSCYKELFARGAEFSYDFADLGAFWHDYDRCMRYFALRGDTNLREQRYESLVRDPEQEIRALLQFCALDFDPACLRFHESERQVRTASASQVRQPLRRDTARTARYGALLDPLRQALGMATGSS